ncbi:MAG: hypothetical protein ACYC75_00715 [Minisyncoccota bacterium]
MKRISFGAVLPIVLFVFLSAGCATPGPQPTGAASTPDVVRTFPNGMRFVLKGDASVIMKEVEKTHLKAWGSKIKGWDKSDIEDKLICPLYADADLRKDYVITPAEAEVYRDITYPKEFATHVGLSVAFPASQ